MNAAVFIFLTLLIFLAGGSFAADMAATEASSPAVVCGTAVHLDNRNQSYDLADRLLSVVYPNEPTTLRNTATSYDALNRITSETSANITHSYPLYDGMGWY